jgi:hypothetical protein
VAQVNCWHQLAALPSAPRPMAGSGGPAYRSIFLRYLSGSLLLDRRPQAESTIDSALAISLRQWLHNHVGQKLFARKEGEHILKGF